MLSLVAYDNSDSEDDSENEKEENMSAERSATMASVRIVKKHTEESDSSEIFVSLPQPQLKQEIGSILEEEDEFLEKKEIAIEKPKKQPVKISIPTLRQFDSDEEEEVAAKKSKIIEKACGLFSLLPPPKTTSITIKHFVPNSVKKNMNSNLKPAKLKAKIVEKRQQIHTEYQDSDDDEDDTIKNLPDTFDEEIWHKVCGKKEKRIAKPISTTSRDTTSTIQSNPDVERPYEGLDNQAFKELIGANSKRKGDDVIDIIDIKEDEVLSDKHLWMTKSLTDPEMAPKYVVKDPVNDTCKRKHHITYLAQQAKANEQELQNQWAASRFTRQKTQAKYGF